MQIQIQSPELTLTEAEKNYVETKVAKLVKYGKRFADESSLIKVELASHRMRTSGNGVNCEVTMFIPGAIIRAEERAHSLHEAVDLVMDKLKHQVIKYKETLQDKKKRGEKVATSLVNVLADYKQDRPAYGLSDRISRRKLFVETKAMPEEEAIYKMELLAHKFFLFLNEVTGRYSVVYKREEGDYGVIELDR